MLKVRSTWLILSLALLAAQPQQAGAQSTGDEIYTVQPGDTWISLAWRFGTDTDTLRTAFPHPNRQRQPPIGALLIPPNSSIMRPGTVYRSVRGGILGLAVGHNQTPWYIAIRNEVDNPYRPLLGGPLIVPGGRQPPRDLPSGFQMLELSQAVARPGQALAVRSLRDSTREVSVSLADVSFAVFERGRHLVALGALGAFYGRGEPELTISVDDSPIWTQPWRVEDNLWDYQQITLTGTAAAIDQESIAQERARLFTLWTRHSEIPLWDQPFHLPISDFLEISSHYGARRSYNGGPYSTYHEGVDFSAYGGTEVVAPATASVALAEKLYVRGGAVILDHGLGIYTGYYHLSEVGVEAGDVVASGQVIGNVGTSGLSTGNHLHWDLLINGTWVDALAWLEQDMACWILEGLGLNCGG